MSRIGRKLVIGCGLIYMPSRSINFKLQGQYKFGAGDARPVRPGEPEASLSHGQVIIMISVQVPVSLKAQSPPVTVPAGARGGHP
jgi:hypothetical protein